MDGALRRRRDGVEAEQRPCRHDDLPAAGAGVVDQVRPWQQGAGAQHHDGLARRQHRPADVLDERRRRGLDGEVRLSRKFSERHDRAVDALLPQPGFGLGAVAGGRAGEREAGNPGGQTARQRPADSAEAGYGNAGSCHEINLPMTSA